jgi:hypothetical protein
VRARLEALAKLAELRVVAPVGRIRWGANGLRRFGGSHPKQRMDHDLRVHYPRWLYLPNGGWLNGVLLFLQLIPGLFRFSATTAGISWMRTSAILKALPRLCWQRDLNRPFADARGNELEHAPGYGESCSVGRYAGAAWCWPFPPSCGISLSLWA